MANTPRITSNTQLWVFNNTTGSVGFEDSNGKRARLPKPGNKKKIKCEDLDYLYNNAPVMIEEFLVVPVEQRFRDYLTENYGVDYNKMLLIDDIEAFLNEKDAEEIKKFLETAPEEIKQNVAKTAKDMKLDSKKKTQAIKDATKLDIEDVDETK